MADPHLPDKILGRRLIVMNFRDITHMVSFDPLRCNIVKNGFYLLPLGRIAADVDGTAGGTRNFRLYAFISADMLDQLQIIVVIIAALCHFNITGIFDVERIHP